jgi:hypothetical protein
MCITANNSQLYLGFLYIRSRTYTTLQSVKQTEFYFYISEFQYFFKLQCLQFHFMVFT